MQSFGAPDMAWVVVPHPMGGISLEAIQAKADKAVPEILTLATRWKPTVTERPIAKSPYPAERFTFRGTLQDVDKLFMEKGWADGFPIVPPTVEAVEEMLKGTDRSPGDVVGLIPPRMGVLTMEMIATNAVMAGSLPTYMPVIIAAVEAMVERDFNLGGVQTTTGAHWAALVVNGPIRKQLPLNYGAGVLGPGWRANATIGRAIRLIMTNVGGAHPGISDMTCIGIAERYTYVLAENEEANPWEPLHVERGSRPEANTVTVAAAWAPAPVCDHVGATPEEILAVAADTMATISRFHIEYKASTSEDMLVLVPEHAETIAKAGWSKDDIRRFLFNQARVPYRQLKDLRRPITLPVGIDPNNLDAMLPLYDKPERIQIVVSGGPGKHSAFLRTGHSARFITKEIRLPRNWNNLLEKYKGWKAPWSR
jgi:hypothetical protein